MKKFQEVPIVPGGEVIIDSPSDKKRQISPAKRWCFTYNNYSEEDISSIVLILEQECSKGIFSKEVGESGTPHLQGYVEFKRKLRPSSIFPTMQIWWEKAKGNLMQNIEYCVKDVTGNDDTAKRQNCCWHLNIPRPVKLINPDRPWEIEILDIIREEPDERTIHWYYGNGGVGKTSFCKYLVMKHKALILGGKAADIRNAICEHTKVNGSTPELIVINIPKSYNSDYLSYEGLENIKDMLFYSGKYEGGMVCGNSPHLFVFANESPNKEKMSLDRWKVTYIM